MQSGSVLTLDGVFSLSGGNTAYSNGVNVLIVNGLGMAPVTNGLGNFIVGYNLSRTTGHPVCSHDAGDSEATCDIPGELWALPHKSGSH